MYKMKVKWNSAVFQQSALGFLLEEYKYYYFIQSQLKNFLIYSIFDINLGI